ncbi:hypothetical protein [Streptomyces sp. NPDC085479]|uniref:hypothetical protein n=1 Tax=Streptomyces sp. NPDC085479 TaxID=3365726 RepID=UPI0037D658F4
MSDGEGEGALVLEAQDMLAGGRATRKSSPTFREDRQVGCLCLGRVLGPGCARIDAEARLREVERLFANFAVSDEEDLAFVLRFGHFFIVGRVLDEHEEHIRDLLGTAARRPRRLPRKSARMVSHRGAHEDLPCPGTPESSKATSTGSGCSNARCSAPASLF